MENPKPIHICNDSCAEASCHRFNTNDGCVVGSPFRYSDQEGHYVCDSYLMDITSMNPIDRMFDPVYERTLKDQWISDYIRSGQGLNEKDIIDKVEYLIRLRGEKK